MTENLHDTVLLERDGLHTVRTDKGFVAYSVIEMRLHCHQFYVHPDFRNSGSGRELLKKTIDKAHELKCAKVSCTVQPAHKLAHETLMATLAGGFQLKGMTPQNHLYFELVL